MSYCHIPWHVCSTLPSGWFIPFFSLFFLFWREENNPNSLSIWHGLDFWKFATLVHICNLVFGIVCSFSSCDGENKVNFQAQDLDYSLKNLESYWEGEHRMLWMVDGSIMRGWWSPPYFFTLWVSYINLRIIILSPQY